MELYAVERTTKLLPLVFGRATAGLALGFVAGFVAGLTVKVGLAAGLRAGACLGVGGVTAGVDLTGFGRIGVSTFGAWRLGGSLACG